MGFKRTSEGRVFFEGSNDDPQIQRRQKARKPEAASDVQSGQTQYQILELLKALNERLKITQAERNKMRHQLETYRGLLEDLGEKADLNEQSVQSTEIRAERAERVAAETLKELEETRKLLLEIEDKTERSGRTVSVLKKQQSEQAQKAAATIANYSKLSKRLKETENKQEDLGAKVENAISQQDRLVRKIDQAIEDRARFMRKMERIEETVIQTRDSLNAKAMVLLTDQTVAAQAAAEEREAHSVPAPAPAQETEGVPLWRRMSLQLQNTSLLLFFAVIAFAGMWIMERQGVTFSDLQEGIDFSGIGESVSDVVSLDEVQDWTIREDTSAFSEEAEFVSSNQSAPIEEAVGIQADDIGALDIDSEQEVLALLEENPDVLAAELNKIEPGLAAELAESTEAVETVEMASLPPQEEVAPIVAPEPIAKELPPAPVEEAKPVEPKPKKAVVSKSEDFLKPDPALPDMIKAIEEQAFKGIPEAQHDLAAVYTAGHAGAQQNYERAAFWFKKAGEQGIANARYNLGVLYHQGLGMDQDINEAIYWYKQAADIGHAEAQYNLGIAYIEGIGVPYNPLKAAEYFEKAAGSGIMEAAYNLGLIHENGLLGEAKPDEALMWYKAASDKGSPEAKAALEQLAKMLGIGLDEVNRIAESMQVVKKVQPKKPAPVKPKSDKQSRVSVVPDSQKVVSNPPAIANTPEESVVRSQGQEQVLLSQIQKYLMDIGLYPGPADGQPGPLTGDAIRSYQALNNLHVNGQSSESLLTHMMANAFDAGGPDDVGSREE